MEGKGVAWRVVAHGEVDGHRQVDLAAPENVVQETVSLGELQFIEHQSRGAFLLCDAQLGMIFKILLKGIYCEEGLPDVFVPSRFRRLEEFDFDIFVRVISAEGRDQDGELVEFKEGRVVACLAVLDLGLVDWTPDLPAWTTSLMLLVNDEEKN